MQAEIWTKHHCPFCVTAKQILNDLKIPYREFIVSPGYDEETPGPNQQYVTKADLLAKYPAAKTVPQIWIDDDYADIMFESILREKIKDVSGWVEANNYWNEEDRERDVRLLAALNVVLQDYSVMEKIDG